ncbi:MAG: ribosome recycling factor [Candidatus Tokpelaia sp. JSC161]|jgi:ribosome recycling factor|nr:MAG: ribosome recycling factor [Candidatus Tokpelaia sp. JSC161]
MFNVEDLNRRMDLAVSIFKKDLGRLRTGRASVSLLEPIMVEAYGSSVSINQLASISAPESRMLSVSVWDKSMIPAVERAIRSFGLGLNPIHDGLTLRIPLPELNEERRRELVKIAHQYAEQARISVRHVRRDGMDDLKQSEKNKDFGKDEIRFLSEKVQEMTDDMINEIDKFLVFKEAEIMKV